MADFPPNGTKEDSSVHTETPEDNVEKHGTEGGYVITRARTTKTSRIFTTGFKSFTYAQKKLVTDFEKSVHYTAGSFTYNLPTSVMEGVTEEISCKFVSPIKWKYRGVGTAIIWDSETITLREE